MSKPETQNSPPNELEELYQKCFSIRRFTRIYSDGIFDDNVGDHTTRCVDGVDLLEIPQKDKEIIKLILWVHDLPEIEISDYSVIQKNDDKAFNNELESSELKAAKKLIPQEYSQYFIDFRNAEEFLSGKTPQIIPSKHALIAKIIDSVDGNKIFHKQLTDWMLSDGYKFENFPSQKSLGYSFSHYVKIGALTHNQPDIFGNLLSIAQNIIEEEMCQITQNWSRVENSKIPETISNGFRAIANTRV